MSSTCAPRTVACCRPHSSFGRGGRHMTLLVVPGPGTDRPRGESQHALSRPLPSTKVSLRGAASEILSEKVIPGRTL